MAIGPASPEEAGKVWEDIAAKGLSFDDILYRRADDVGDSVLNEMAKKMVIPTSMSDHVVMVAGQERISIVIRGGKGEDSVKTYDLPAMLACGDFLVTPLISPRGAIGVIIADNRITGAAIGDNDIRRLEMFASQASLAIERTRLHQEMLEKIDELEKATRELARTRDHIVAMERYSAIGHMTAQLAHDIRNPLASIGAAASWLEKKCDDPRYYRFLEIIVKETNRIESVLTSMFAFASDSDLSLARHSLTPLIEEALLVLRLELHAAAVASQFMQPPDEVFVNVDAAKMREAFLLLIKNTILAMPAGGFLRVEISRSDSQAMVTFRHSGLSLVESNSQGEAVELFHGGLFYKLLLGLTMARQIISRHGGKIFLSFPEEGGAVARVMLPEA
jgi:signal transduction histidine kinase